MDIIFQSGDFYNDSNSLLSNLMTIFSALLGALISGLIAIYIFNKGLEKEKQKKRDYEIKESNELEQYFFHNIESIKFFINKQIDEISKCSQRTKNWNDKNLLLSIFPELNTKYIWEINQEKLYTIFVRYRDGDLKEKAEDFINVRNCLYNIDNFIKVQSEINTEISQRLIVSIELWNQSLKQLMSFSNSFVIDYNSSPNKGKDDFLKLFTFLMTEKQRQLKNENKHENMEIMVDEIIVPLKTFLKENKESSDKRIYQISEPIMNMQKAYYEIENLRRERRKKALFSGRNLLKIKALLNERILSTKSRNKNYDQ
jgi:hypothetical protein